MTGSASVPCPNSESRMPSTENLPMKKLISKCKSQWSRSVFAITLVSLATLFFALSANRLRSATPASGTLDPNGPNTSQSWSATVVAPAGSDIEPSCVDGVSCDTYTVTLSGSPSNWLGKRAHIVISWDFSVGDDFDVVIHKGSNAGPVVASAFTASSTQPEVLDIDPNAAGAGRAPQQESVARTQIARGQSRKSLLREDFAR